MSKSLRGQPACQGCFSGAVSLPPTILIASCALSTSFLPQRHFWKTESILVLYLPRNQRLLQNGSYRPNLLCIHSCPRCCSHRYNQIHAVVGSLDFRNMLQRSRNPRHAGTHAKELVLLLPDGDVGAATAAYHLRPSGSSGGNKRNNTQLVCCFFYYR